jgi:hypothetical protein
VFVCVAIDESAGIVLAKARGNNKKVAKNIACEAAIAKLWFERHTEQKLLPEDGHYLHHHPEILTYWPKIRDIDVLEEPVFAWKIDKTPNQLTYKCAIFLSWKEKNQMPSMLLNQFHSQGKLHVRFLENCLMTVDQI